MVYAVLLSRQKTFDDCLQSFVINCIKFRLILNCQKVNFIFRRNNVCNYSSSSSLAFAFAFYWNPDFIHINPIETPVSGCSESMALNSLSSSLSDGNFCISLLADRLKFSVGITLNFIQKFIERLFPLFIFWQLRRFLQSLLQFWFDM